MKARDFWLLGAMLGTLLTPGIAGAQADAGSDAVSDAVSDASAASARATAVRRFVQERGPVRAWALCQGQLPADSDIRRWCINPESASIPSSTQLAAAERAAHDQEAHAQADAGAPRDAGRAPGVRVAVGDAGTRAAGGAPSTATSLVTGAESLASAASPQMAIADVLLRGLAQFLLTRATAELQTTVVERLQHEVCPDVEAACQLSDNPDDPDNDWPAIRDHLSGTCDNACNHASADALNACWRGRREAGCFYDGTCSQVEGCHDLPNAAEPDGGAALTCAACLHRDGAELLQRKARRCFNAVLASELASHTCGLLARNDYFSPTFGNAFRAAVVDDVISLPANALHVLMGPLGVPMTLGTRDRLVQAFTLKAIDQIVHATTPANAGRELRTFVNAWNCTGAAPPDGPNCANLKSALSCGLDVFVSGAELARSPTLPEDVVEGVLVSLFESGACHTAGVDAIDQNHRELIVALIRSFANVTRDIERLRGASATTNAPTTTTSTTITTTSTTTPSTAPATTEPRAPTAPSPPPTITPAEPVVQTLTRDLVEVVNLSIKIGSRDLDRPVFQIPDGVPEFVGAIAANDVPAALSRGLRVTARVVEQVSSPAPGFSLRTPSAVVRALSFGADLVAARTPDDAEAALDAFSAPVGSWRGKGVRPMFSITGMVGVSGGGDYTFARNGVRSSLDGVGSLTGMVGADLTCPIHNSFFTYWGGFLSVLDVGGLVAQAASTPAANGAATQSALNPLQFVAPGLFLHINLFGSPINLMAGAQFLPVARTLQYTDSAGNTQSVDVSAVRFMGALSVDVTILPF